MDPIISTTGLCRRYKLGKNNEVAALLGASVEIAAGELVAIVGPSGSGKSTLMHLIGCLDSPDSGRVFINGRRVDNLKGRALTRVRSSEIGFIFQGFNLIPPKWPQHATARSRCATVPWPTTGCRRQSPAQPTATRGSTL